jgi:hypothetical protein
MNVIPALPEGGTISLSKDPILDHEAARKIIKLVRSQPGTEKLAHFSVKLGLGCNSWKCNALLHPAV